MDSNHLLIFSEHSTSRLNFVAKEIFARRLGIDFTISNSKTEFTDFKGAKINYSTLKIPGAYPILPQGLLFEDGIPKSNAPFLPENFSSPSFDLLSSAFYHLARVEEYNSKNLDSHGRFESSASILYPNQMILQPVVDQYAQLIAENLKSLFPKTIFPKKRVGKLISTIDLDQFYAFKNKGLKRTSLGLLKDIVLLDFHNLFQRIASLIGNKDPFFKVAKMVQWNAKANKGVRLFVHAGKRKLPFDNTDNISIPKVRNLLISFKNQIGLHPSYASHTGLKLLEEEKSRLENSIGMPVYKSRQHYLKFTWPATQHNLIKIGITEDYSMGYANQIGFRAGTAFPFQFFDVMENKEYPLLIHPLHAMDTTLNSYMKLDVKSAEVEVKNLARKCYEVGGDFYLLWHNEGVSEWKHWRGWKKLYKKLLKY